MGNYVLRARVVVAEQFTPPNSVPAQAGEGVWPPGLDFLLCASTNRVMLGA